jgi:hypothetical protein
MKLSCHSGEAVEVPIGALFCCRSGHCAKALVEVICQDRTQYTHGQGVICCRVLQGSVEVRGQRLPAGTLVNFEADMVAELVKQFREEARTAHGAA